ncbi:MAG: hypothetical protein IJW21_03810 [Clostridia bacterium]|nr:hypothetical protein [Clostridia bacterium]
MGASLFICGVFRSEKLLALCVFAFAGLLAYISAISIRKSAGFNVPVAAEYIGLEAFSLRGREHFIPQFRYTHKNETVTASEIRSYSKSKCEKLFREGEKYTVYIKPSARGQCSYGKKFPPYLFILPALSALFAVLSVIILIFV